MAQRDDYLGFVFAGWVLALVLPIGGIVASFVLADRRPGHAAGILLASLAWLATAFILLVLRPM